MTILQVQSMLQVNISERLGCLKGGLKDLKRHKWFAEIDWNKLANRETKVSRHSHTFLCGTHGERARPVAHVVDLLSWDLLQAPWVPVLKSDTDLSNLEPLNQSALVCPCRNAPLGVNERALPGPSRSQRLHVCGGCSILESSWRALGATPSRCSTTGKGSVRCGPCLRPRLPKSAAGQVLPAIGLNRAHSAIQRTSFLYSFKSSFLPLCLKRLPLFYCIHQRTKSATICVSASPVLASMMMDEVNHNMAACNAPAPARCTLGGDACITAGLCCYGVSTCAGAYRLQFGQLRLFGGSKHSFHLLVWQIDQTC